MTPAKQTGDIGDGEAETDITLAQKSDGMSDAQLDADATPAKQVGDMGEVDAEAGVTPAKHTGDESNDGQSTKRRIDQIDDVFFPAVKRQKEAREGGSGDDIGKAKEAI